MSSQPIQRRTLLATGAAAAALTSASSSAEAGPSDSRRHYSSQLSYPFTLGVASGDPSSDGVVLWTRLAPSPVDDDGMGGMSTRRTYRVQWQLATDPKMQHIIRRGSEETSPDDAHTVHLELSGLQAGAEYYYRFRYRSHLSPIGRTRTAPDGVNSTMRFAVASCQAWIGGHYTAHRRLAEDRPDLVLFLGDYIYEHMSDSIGRHVREHVGPRPLSVASYRQRYALYKSDPDLQAAHAVAPWLVILDDHEVANGWSGPEAMPALIVPGYAYLDQRANAFKAFYEHMPLRRSARPQGPDMQLYRRVRWGPLATFYCLDTRQYRTGITTTPEEAVDPRRTMLGAEQESWLLNEMAASGSAWNIMLNQTQYTRLDIKAGEEKRYLNETWEGYAATRDRITNGMIERSVANPVVFTGNQHRNTAGDILQDFDDPDGPAVAAEFVGTSIASGRDGTDTNPAGERQLLENPWLKFINMQRGYLRTDLTADQMQVDFRVLPYVTRPGAPVSTRASYVVESGHPGVQPMETP